jgi:predicted PurR-regulated permease PerM
MSEMPMRSERGTPIDITHVVLAVLCLVLLIAAAFWVMQPFFTPLLWATIVAVATWPLLLRLQGWLGVRRGIAVTIVTTMFLLAVFVPVTVALSTIVGNARSITTDINALQSVRIPEPPSWLSSLPFGGRRLAAEWRTFADLGPQERLAAVTPFVQTALRWFAAKAGSVGTMLIQFLLTGIITAMFLANGEAVRDAILRFAGRLAGRQGEEAALLAARAIRSVVLGVVGTALIQTAIGGAGLVIAGVPAAGLLSAVLLFLCLSQLGPMPVMIPGVVWLYWSDRTGYATALLVIALVAGTIDNILRPLLIRRTANLPIVLIFAGVIGGLLGFGIIGLFIGPVVLAVTYTLLTVWVGTADVPSREAEAEPAAAEVPVSSISR